VENLKKPRHQRPPDAQVFAEADAFHDSPGFMDDATNIQIGTRYLQTLVDHETDKGVSNPVSEAYKDYRGVRNGIYYNKIKAAADKLKADPDNTQVLRDMVQ